MSGLGVKNLNMKKLHFKIYRYILSRSYPFDHWLVILTSYFNLWFYSIIFSSIFCFIFETTFVEYMKFYFVFNSFFMIFIIFKRYKLEFFKLVYHTVDQLFRMTIGRLFGLRPIDYNYKPFDQRKYYGKNVLDFNNERSKIFQKKYEEIDFLVLNDYITIEEGNKRIDELLKEEYRSGFLVTLNGHYKMSEVD